MSMLPPFAYFEYGRLRLEPGVPDHLPAWKTFMQDPQVMRFIKGGWEPDDVELLAFLLRNHRNWERHRMGWWSVSRRESNEIIGSCVLNISCSDASEIGYLVARDSWRQGFGREIVAALCHYGFAVEGLDALKAYVNVDNLGSIKVVERLDFRCVAEAVFAGRRCHRYELRSSAYASFRA